MAVYAIESFDLYSSPAGVEAVWDPQNMYSVLTDAELVGGAYGGLALKGKSTDNLQLTDIGGSDNDGALHLNYRRTATGTHKIARIIFGVTVQFYLQAINGNTAGYHKYEIRRGVTNALIGTSSEYPDGFWEMLSLYFETGNASNGSVLLYVDALEEINVDPVNTDPAAFAEWESLDFPLGGGEIDDILVLDSKVPSATDLMSQIEELLPIKDGTSLEWLPDGGAPTSEDHWPKIAEEGDADDDTTYLESTSGAGNKDLFYVGQSDKPSGLTLWQTQLMVRGRKAVGDPNTAISIFANHDGNETDYGSIDLTDTYRSRTKGIAGVPGPPGAWTRELLSEAQFGFESDQ